MIKTMINKPKTHCFGIDSSLANYTLFFIDRLFQMMTSLTEVMTS